MPKSLRQSLLPTQSRTRYLALNVVRLRPAVFDEPNPGIRERGQVLTIISLFGLHSLPCPRGADPLGTKMIITIGGQVLYLATSHRALMILLTEA